MKVFIPVIILKKAAVVSQLTSGIIPEGACYLLAFHSEKDMGGYLDDILPGESIKYMILDLEERVLVNPSRN